MTDKDIKTITNYYLHEAIEKVQELVLKGYRVNPNNTYRMGTINQIAMERSLTQEEVEIQEVQDLEDWEEAQSAIKDLEKEYQDDNKDNGSDKEVLSEEEVPRPDNNTDSTDILGDSKEELSIEDMDLEQLRSYAKENGVNLHHKMTNLDNIRDKITEELKGNE